MTTRPRIAFHLNLRPPPYRKSPVIASFIVLAGIVLASVFPAGPAGYPAYAGAADTHVEYAENRTSPVARFLAYDQDGDAIRWSLSGPDADLFTIEDGVLAFREPPNHEALQSVARGGPLADGNVFRVTVEASGGTHDVAVTVTDVDEAGEVAIDRPQPQVDRPLGAALSEEDDGVRIERWQWARSEDGTTWTDIRGATTPRRSPAPEDVGAYLRATVTYSDRFGPGKTASAVSAHRAEARTLSNAAPSFAEQDENEDTPYMDVSRSVAENTAVGMNIGEPASASDDDDDILCYELLDTPDLRNGPSLDIGDRDENSRAIEDRAKMLNRAPVPNPDKDVVTLRSPEFCLAALARLVEYTVACRVLEGFPPDELSSQEQLEAQRLSEMEDWQREWVPDVLRAGYCEDTGTPSACSTLVSGL